MVELKTAAEIDAMAAAGAVVAEALRAVVAHAKPGQAVAELDTVAADVLARHGATSPFLNYHPRWAPIPFPAVLCVSVNDAVRTGNTLGDVGHAISSTARGAGYGLLADHGGHGIGRTMHEAPHVPNEGRPGKGMRVRTGVVIAIEPMLIADGSDDYTHDSDGWTLRTASGARAAHSEHTVAVTADGPRILTN